MKRFKRKLLMAMVLLAGGAYGVLAWWLSISPAPPPLRQVEGAPAGSATILAVVDMMRAQLRSHGGWQPNDTPLLPSFYADNNPQFQLGVLQVARQSSLSLRDHLTRQRASDAVQPETDRAYSYYANDAYKWLLPAPETVYERANLALENYAQQLGQGGGTFYPRADNLVQLLGLLIPEMGGVSNRLLVALEGEEIAWWEVDDRFFYAKGVSYGTLVLMRAIRHDFAETLRDKRASDIVDRIVHALEQTQFEPLIVFNDGKSGLFANHTSNLKVFLDDALQRMRDLEKLLTDG